MATQITSDNFEQYFLEAMNAHGADAMSDDGASGGIVDITADSIGDAFKMLLLNTATGQEEWKKAAITEVAKKIDALLSVMHNATVVAELPQASAQTVGRMYLVPAALTTTALWDWVNGVPATLRGITISGVDASGTLPSDNRLYGIAVGPATEGNTVSLGVAQSSDTFVTIGTGASIRIPANKVGDAITVNFAGGTASNCEVGGTALSGDTYSHTVVAADVEQGYIELVTTGTVKISSIGATYLAGNVAQGFDPQHVECDKYLTIAVADGNNTVYRWEQLSPAYIDMSEYYTKAETSQIMAGTVDGLLTGDNTFVGDNEHTGEDTWSSSQDSTTTVVNNEGVTITPETLSYYAKLEKDKLTISYYNSRTHQTDSVEVTASGITITQGSTSDTLTLAKLQTLTDFSGDLADITERLEEIGAVIPDAATPQNPLADQAYVNDHISTASATFRGTSAAGLTEQQFLAWANGLTHNLNDYVYWNTVDSVGNVLYKRYKYNGSAWIFEYSLNNTPLTEAQWATVNSGLTGVTQAQFDTIFD